MTTLHIFQHRTVFITFIDDFINFYVFLYFYCSGSYFLGICTGEHLVWSAGSTEQNSAEVTEITWDSWDAVSVILHLLKEGAV